MGQLEKFFVLAILILVAVVTGITLFGGEVEANPGELPMAGIDPPLVPEDDNTPVEPEGQGNTDSGDQSGLFRRNNSTPADGGGQDPASPDTPHKLDVDEPDQATPPKKVDPVPPPASPRRIQKAYGHPYVIVKKGEVLGTIMETFLGSAHRYRDEVLEINEDLNPDRIREGDRIWLPAKRLLANPRTAANPTAPRAVAGALTVPSRPRETARSAATYTLYKTRPGDSLWKIAKRHYGDDGNRIAKGIEAIKRANRGLKLDPLRTNRTLHIPKGF